MATCDMGYDHADLAPEPAAPEPVVIESGPNENDVKIAEIEAAASIKREEIYADERVTELLAEVERQRGEITGMREILDRLVPPEPPADPEPVPAVVPVQVNDASGDEAPPPAEAEARPAPKKKSGGWWA